LDSQFCAKEFKVHISMFLLLMSFASS